MTNETTAYQIWFKLDPNIEIGMIINLISSPRNISTATMYSFAHHGQFKVIDEPYYAYYLQLTGLHHPGREEIIASQPTDPAKVLSWINRMQDAYQHVFIKNMAHHLIQLNLQFLHELTNIILIRDPRQLITSFSKVISNPKMSDIGVKRQFEIFELLGKKCIVLDSNEILKNPERVFVKLFAQLDIPFQPEMLQWTPGPIPEDGVWAKYWYSSVHQSSGFQQKNASTEIHDQHASLLKEAMPYYEAMHQYCIKAD